MATAEAQGSTVAVQTTEDQPISNSSGASQLQEGDQTPVDQAESIMEESAEIRMAEKEAKDAILEAVKKMRALKMATKVDISKELAELIDAAEEFPSPPDSVNTSTVSTRSPSPTGVPDISTFRSPGQAPNHPPRQPIPNQPAQRISQIDISDKLRSCTVQRLSMEDWRVDGSSGLPPGVVGSINGHPQSRAPVIQAYYRNTPSESELASRKDFDGDLTNAHTNTQNTGKPQRIKINSSILLDDLELISGLTLSNRPHYIIPPFKLLIHNVDGIKSKLEELTSEVKDLDVRKISAPTTASLKQTDLENDATMLDPSMNGPEGPEASGEQSETHVSSQEKESVDEVEKKSHKLTERAQTDGGVGLAVAYEKLQTRVAHLQCLYDYISTDLRHLVGLSMRIQEGTLETITFDGVYHLYSPGDLIINREDDVDLLYQVYAVTGGRMRLQRYVNIYRPQIEEEEADNSPTAGIGTWTDVVIDCFRMHWDGTQIGPKRMTHRVRHFTGEKKITELDYYPVRFRQNSEDLCKGLEIRGKKLLGCHGHKKYDGLTAKPPRSREHMRVPRPIRGPGPPPPPPAPGLGFTKIGKANKELESDIFVDFKTFAQTFPYFDSDFDTLGRVRPSTREVTESFPRKDRDYHAGDHDVDEARSDKFLSTHFHLAHPKRPEELNAIEDYLMLLPQCVPAFEFRHREWNYFDVDKLEEIDKSDDARRRGWEDLVINEGYSQLLLSLVDNHASAYDLRKKTNAAGHGVSTAQIDLIKGKGRGLIILLHGPPGTGKTSTAETIAAYTGRPLYAITCGDIGVSASEVEENLRVHTERAQKWGCVLLLDEADVFMAKRTWDVFLRHLEYYSGILFLTTNIVGIIDEAFKSRIHIALRYDSIDLGSTQLIWNNLLDRIIKDNDHSEVKIKFDRDILLDFAQSHYEKNEANETTWNARQIRNAFSTAIAMGQFDRLERIRKEGLKPDEVASSGKKSLMTIRLTNRNFSKIADTAADFEKYLNAVRGPDADNALASQQRDDYFARQLTPLPVRKRGWGGPDQGYSSRRQDHVAMPASRPGKGKRSAKKASHVEEGADDYESEDEDVKGSKHRQREEEYSDDDDESEAD
ncbi:hypothetical protein JX265_006971 [Neoarthrinium moseri]|uniref:AAA+ ATPase domain-containing protein n=1 Tax=Neoarthrinium moseri TaxID=1658444 RepID=A0A9P9WLL3_9PEZI|nr:hypothetical protein JX265_006971 [Neoarthrinium moseri]